MSSKILAFGDFTLDLANARLVREGVPVPLEPKCFDLLRVLIERRGELVTKDEIYDALWPDAAVSPGVLTRCVSLVRQALGDDGRSQRFIRTHAKRGYAFVGEVRASDTRARVDVPPAPASKATFVDRRDEAKALLSVVDAARAGTGRAAFVIGPPGIGKSYTLAKLCDEAAARGLSVHVARAWRGAEGAPYAIWQQVLRSLARGTAEAELETWLGNDRENVLAVAPDLSLGIEPGAAPAGALDARTARSYLFASLSRFIARAAHAQPRLLVLDDLHWADSDSVSLLRELIERLDDVPIAVLGAYREAELGDEGERESALRDAALHPRSRRIELSGLDRDATVELIEAVAGRAAADAAADRIFRVTRGHPLYASELARLLGGDSPGESAGDTAIPDRVMQIVRLRLAQQDAACREALELAAVVGPEFELRLLQAISARGGPELLTSLDRARRADFVEPRTPGLYGFVHELVRDAIYEQIELGRRATIHAQVADVLERDPGTTGRERLARLAHHYCAAGPLLAPEKAISYLRKAALDARARFALADAASFLERAIDLATATSVVSPAERCALLIELGERLTEHAAKQESILAHFARARWIADDIGSVELAARAALGELRCVLERDISALSPGRARELWEAFGVRAEGLLQQLPQDDSRVRAHLLLHTAELLFLMDETRDGSEKLLIEGTEMCVRLGDDEGVLRGRLSRILRMGELEQVAERRAELEAVVKATERSGLARESGWAQHMLACQAFERADFGEVHRRIGALSRTGQTLGIEDMTITWGCLLETARGSFERARALVEQHASVARRAGYPIERVLAAGLLQQWYIHFLRGNPSELLPALELPNLVETPYGQTLSALTHALADRPDLARVRLGDPTAFVSLRHRPSWLVLMCRVVETCAELDSSDAADLLYEHLLPFAERLPIEAWGLGCFAPVNRSLGLLSILRRRPDQACEHLERALPPLEELGARPWLALTRLDLARALVARGRDGDVERVRNLTSDAARTLDDLGMRPPPRLAALAAG